MGDPRTVILITSAYPTHPVHEVTFVAPELEHLARSFDRVVLAPAAPGAVVCPLPPGPIEIDHSLAASLHPRTAAERRAWLVRALADPWLYSELFQCPTLLLHPRSLRRLGYCVAAARRAARWLLDLLASGRCGPERSLIYTFWLNYLTAGAGLARMRCHDMTIVSRAHGADVYRERYRPPHIPLHARAVAAADRVFAASEAARSHLREAYGKYRDRIDVAPLGSPDPGFGASPSQDGVVRLLSCSNLYPLKRVDLLIEGIAALGQMRRSIAIEWCHIGDGDLRIGLEGLAAQKLPGNVRWEFLGRRTPFEVMDHYRRHPVDLFVSASASEGGTPLSMKEALSCAVPVLATSVGGVPELVSSSNGALLPADPSPSDIAAAVASLLDSPDLAGKRLAARRTWEGSSDAQILGPAFARRLRSLVA